MTDLDLVQYGYCKLECIGKGQFGAAWTVQAAKDGQPDGAAEIEVAKLVSLELLNAHDQRLALQEVELLKKLSHPHVVLYKQSFIAQPDPDGSPVLAILMDYCRGGDLRQAIKRQKQGGQWFPEQQVLRWFCQLAQAIAHIHSCKVIHRDLKTSNIFLTLPTSEGGFGDVRLADFGISRVLEATAAAANTLLGTPYYMAPEVCQSEPYGMPSDVWALGCVLYELCGLKHAFQAGSLADLVQKVCRGEPDPIPQIYSPGVSGLIKRLLTKSAAERPRAQDLMEDQLLKAIIAAPRRAAPSLRPKGAAAPAASPEKGLCDQLEETQFFTATEE